jgi:hypothetical protein
MLWARMVGYVTGTVNEELLLRNQYLAAENQVLRGQIKGRLLLSEGEKATLAEIAQRLGRKALEELAAVAKPDTLLAWYRKQLSIQRSATPFARDSGTRFAAGSSPRIGLPLEASEHISHLDRRSKTWEWTSGSELTFGLPDTRAIVQCSHRRAVQLLQTICPSLPEFGWGLSRFSRPLVRVAWARCTAPRTPS